MKSRVLVTGATGFVGSHLCAMLSQAGYRVRAAVRSGRGMPAGAAETVLTGDLNSDPDWTEAVQGVDCVVHAAARVHMLHDSPANAGLYRQANAEATRKLAAASIRAGVRRFIYLSSIKVNGEATSVRPFSAADAPAPLDDYGRSKLRAEQMLFAAAAGSGMEAIAIRPPLVYGPGVRANFLRLMSWVHRRVPLPLGSVSNARSMVSIWNLCDLIRCAVAAERSVSGVLLVSDGDDLSTPQLVRGLAAALSVPARLIPVPPLLLHAGGSLIGRSAEVSRLLGSLQVDISATQACLNWKPGLPVGMALARTAQWYLEAASKHGQ